MCFGLKGVMLLFQIAVPYLQTGLGWNSVFYLFMICVSIGVILINNILK